MSDFEDSDIRYSYDSPLRSDGNTSISRGFRGSSVTAHTSPPPSSDIDDIINNTGATAFRNPGTSHRDNGGYIGAESHKFGLDPIDPADDLQKLKQAWVSERTAPELLPFVQEIVDRVMGRIRKQIEYIEINSMNMTAAPDAKLKLLIVETDLERVKFVLRGYLRARLLKIDTYMAYLIDSPSRQKKLSQSEVAYLKEHNEMLSTLYKAQFLGRIPEQLRNLKDESDVSMVVKPDLLKPVFIHVLEDIPEPVRAGNEDLVLEKDGMYVLRYSAVRRYIKSGSAVLI